jgi:hypothetical protein
VTHRTLPRDKGQVCCARRAPAQARRCRAVPHVATVPYWTGRGASPRRSLARADWSPPFRSGRHSPNLTPPEAIRDPRMRRSCTMQVRVATLSEPVRRRPGRTPRAHCRCLMVEVLIEPFPPKTSSRALLLCGLVCWGTSGRARAILTESKVHGPRIAVNRREGRAAQSQSYGPGRLLGCGSPRFDRPHRASALETAAVAARTGFDGDHRSTSIQGQDMRPRLACPTR